MKILVTGAAGFIGFHLVERLARLGHELVGLDCINAYYDVGLKYDRLARTGIGPAAEEFGRRVPSTTHPAYRFVRLDLTDREGLERLFAEERFDAAVHLAAQAGVRYSLENPHAYIESNVVGFLNLLECVRHRPVRHFVYASSSSVYGGNPSVPFSEEDRVDRPVSLYAATKKSNELMAHVYSGLYGIPTTGLRFFTVYGPWGRPDMAPMLFSRAILAGEPIRVFNRGALARDFTYIDDIIEGVVRVLDLVPQASAGDAAPAAIYNIGCGRPVPLMDFIRTLEEALGRKARMELVAMQPGDVPTTYADTSRLRAATGYEPRTTLAEGIGRFVAWYTEYYRSADRS